MEPVATSLPAGGYDNVVGARARFGVIIPSTNTVVEQDFSQVARDLPGVSFHYGRMYIENPVLDSDAAFEALLGQIRASINVAVRDVVTAKVSSMLMGMSAETFWGGVAGNAAFEARIGERSGGLKVSTGAASCRAALEAFGVQRIAVFSPYQAIADVQVAEYFTEAGASVAAITGLRCPSATAIAEVGSARIAEIIEQIDDSSVEAIVQVGTNLSFVQQAAALERELAKPVIAINMATLWHALRSTGIEDRIAGCGRLLEEF
jgi:maleate isomerase